MSDEKEIKINPENFSPEMMKRFQEMMPRTIIAEANPDAVDKKGATFSGGFGSMFNPALYANLGTSYGGSIYRTPARRFYDPEITTTAIYLPRNLRQKNRWCRWFFDHDEFVGAVLELHADLPHSRAEIIVNDKSIKRHIEECLDKTKFFSMLPPIDLEFMKIGEVFIHTPWDDTNGMWSHIILHNPDFVEVKTSPFADTECIIELKPDEELKKIIHSTKPEEQQLKKRLPKEVVRRVLTGKNILLDSNEVTHIARRSNPYDVRGTSLLARLFRLLMYEDKLREAQITIADNFIYPLKVFKLGDPQKGWIPDESHQRALAQMLQNANFDPNFSLIYHYGLQVEYITVAEKVMRLDKEWQEITEKKMIALGVSKNFINGDSSYASANVGLQTQLARYKAKRDLFEIRWMQDKFFRIMAERNEWYERDAREIVGHYRVKRSAAENKKRLIMPKLMWHKKLMLRDDQQFLTFLHNVHAQGKGPISAITLLMAMGLELDTELRNKRKQKELEEIIGEYIQAPPATPGGAPGAPGGGGLPGLGALAKLKDKFKTGKKDVPVEEEKSANVEASVDTTLSGSNTEPPKYISNKKALELEKEYDIGLTNDIIPLNSEDWHRNINSPYVASEVIFVLNTYDNKLKALDKKYNGNFKQGIIENKSDLMKSLKDIYVQGKLTAYDWASFAPEAKYSYTGTDQLRDYSDLYLVNEFEEWIDTLANIEDIQKDKCYRHVRDIAHSCYCYGQLKGFQEQGIYNVKISNSQAMDGLRYQVNELNKKGKNLASIVSPLGDIVIFAPCIEGFDDPELGNMIESKVVKYKNATINGIRVKECPVEYFPFIERYINKLGKYLKKQYDNIFFVKDVIDLPEWEADQRVKLEQEYKDVKADIKTHSILNTLNQEKMKKLGKVPVFGYARTLYISNWIGMEDIPITENFIKYIKLDDASLDKIAKNFEAINLDLTQDEMETYKVFGYIDPIHDSNDNIIGWGASRNITASDKSIYSKISLSVQWDADGKCKISKNKNASQIFEENIKIWIDYPHKLTEGLKQAFEKI
jgi:hypothetical protein